jgi:SAM-dependent methyltransferase
MNTLTWQDDQAQAHTARWQSTNAAPVPKRLRLADDSMSADNAYKLVCEGTALLWQGDYHQARQMLQALSRRIDARRARKPAPTPTPATATATATATAPASLTQAFHQHRKAQAERARILGLLVLPFEADHSLNLRRAPDARLAARAALGEQTEPYVASLRELLGWIGAWEWRQNGVPLPQLGERRNGEVVHIHPHYGVFSPVRNEYLDLLAQAPLPKVLQAPGAWAFDIGTGTGVMAALLAQRGVAHIEATDIHPAALACARENLQRMGLQHRVKLSQCDLFPEGQAALIVCNPPWLPGRPSSPLEAAIYDPDSAMLRGFLAGVAAHLLPGGEAWLVLSDLAEHLGLRSPEQLQAWFDAAGLQVLGRLTAKPQHRKARDPNDPLHAARAAEVTSLWRLGCRET